MACIRRNTPGTTAPVVVSASTAVRSPARLPCIGWQFHPKQLHPQEASMRQLCKGNVALMKGAILAGCRAFYG